MKEGSQCATDARADATHEYCGKPHRAHNHAMKCARLRKRSAEGGSPEDPMGGHMNTPHRSPGRDVEGQAEDGELSRREGREIEGKEGYVANRICHARPDHKLVFAKNLSRSSAHTHNEKHLIIQSHAYQYKARSLCTQ